MLREMSKEKLIPTLRFPEFKDDGEWEEKPLSKISKTYQPKTISQNNFTDEGYSVFGANGVIGKYHKYNHESEQIAITCRGSSSGTVNWTEPFSWITGNAMVININASENTIKKFIFFQLYHQNLNYLITGSGQPQITGDIKNHIVIIPNKKEQQKIASCLSSLDELITAHSDKLQALKDHKKGLMQNLFPQEGQKVPNYRFPELKDDGEWSKNTLEDVADSQSSNLALNKIKPKEDGFPVYGADSIVCYIDKYQQVEKYISIVKDGSGVGRLNLCQPKSSILGTLACIKSKDPKKFNLDWIYYLMNTIDFSSYKKGSGIPHIYFSNFKIEGIRVPQPKEQQKIASCLSSLDELITAQTEKIEQLRQHKKGLMQGLFPKNNN